MESDGFLLVFSSAEELNTFIFSFNEENVTKHYAGKNKDVELFKN